MSVFVFFQHQYKVKWANYPTSDNSWVNADHLDCDRLLQEFEREWHQTAKITTYKLLFNSNETRAIPSYEARDKWPELVYSFLIKNIVWERQTGGTIVDDKVFGNVAGIPKEVKCEYI